MISIGFILSLWSGSRALNVFVDTITIMYGLGGRRGIVRTRMLSFSLYVVGLIVGVVVIPLTLAGPELVDKFLPERLRLPQRLYWPIVIAGEHRLPGQPVPPVGAGADVVALQPARRDLRVRALGVRQRRAAVDPDPCHNVDLRTARRRRSRS